MYRVEPFGVGLHQAVLDTVVNHLQVVTGTMPADVGIAAFRGEGKEDRLEAFVHLRLAAYHEAVAVLETPDTAARADVDVVNAAGFELGRAARIIVEVAIAAIDQNVAGFELRGEALKSAFGSLAGRNHYPDCPRRRQIGGQLVERRNANRAES